MLIVDDNPTVRRLLREFLEAVHPRFRIAEAATGAEAIAQCRAHVFSVVLLDLGLPDVSGVELIVPIRASQPACHIIVVSQNAAPAYEEHMRALGASGFVSKDAVFRELAPAIAQAASQEASRAAGSCR